MMHEDAERVTGFRFSKTAYWLVEENPKTFVAGLLQFVNIPRQSRGIFTSKN